MINAHNKTEKALQVCKGNKNYQAWKFTVPQNTGKTSNLLYYIMYKGMEPHSLGEPMMFIYLCKDGTLKASDGLHEGACLFHSRDEVYACLHECEKQLHQYTAQGDYPVALGNTFSVGIRKAANPERLFTMPEVESAIRESDDSINNKLVVDENGYVHCISDLRKALSYPVRLETFAANAKYVETDVPQNIVRDFYYRLLFGWRQYLEGGDRSVFVDVVHEKITLEQLQQQVQSYY